MKELFTLAILLFLSITGFSQASQEKTKGKQKKETKTKEKTRNEQQTGKPDDVKNNNGNTNTNSEQNGNQKTRKNIPTQVRNSFTADYPNAVNAVWSKNRGDWTVVFGNGVWRSTATYHSNGERVDTRTTVTREQAPRPVLDEILRRYPTQTPKDIIKIEKPRNPNLFQIIVEEAGKKRTLLIDENGKLVSKQ